MQTQKLHVYEKFEQEQPYWEKIYCQSDYSSFCFQRRQEVGIQLCDKWVKPGGRILDAGCGCGHATVELARRGFYVTGLDISASMIAQAARNAAQLGFSELCSFEVGDFERATARLGEFDGILALGFIEYFDDAVKVLETFRAMLNPGGVAVVQIWNRRSFSAVLEEPLLSLRHLAHPINLARKLLREHLPKSWVAKIRGHQVPVAQPPADVRHCRYSPEEFRLLAGEAGLVIREAFGSRFVSAHSPLSDSLKRRIERRVAELATKHSLVMRWANDYTAALGTL